MGKSVDIGDIRVEVTRKDIRNLHLSVYPPTGAVRIAAPRWMEAEAIRLFAISKLGWIRRQQRKLRQQEREPAREYIERESHYVWGRRYLLEVAEHDAAPAVELKHRKLVLRVRPGTGTRRREAILDEWYRDRLHEAVVPLLDKWQPRVGRKASHVYVQRMKTKWGSCNPGKHHIRLNTELAKKPPECLEYIVLHELAHLRESTHNERFIALMDRLMPRWRERRDQLNRLPIATERRHC